MKGKWWCETNLTILTIKLEEKDTLKYFEPKIEPRMVDGWMNPFKKPNQKCDEQQPLACGINFHVAE